MTTPNNGDTVTIDYILKRSDGEIVGNTADVGPQQVQLGGGQMFPQIEEALVEMELGESKTIEIPSDKAFGPRHEQLVFNVPRANLPTETVPQPGMALEAQDPEGRPTILIILEVNEDAVKVDGNHPLAGEDLTFELTLRGVQPAA